MSSAGVLVSGVVLEPSDVPRGVPSSEQQVGEFSYTASAVVVAGGGIGGNQDLVRAHWPTGWGDPPAQMLSGVPDFVDGSMLSVTSSAGGRLINSDRMWHYPEGIVNHAPLWSHHGIRILPGPSSLWLDARGDRLPSPLFPGFDALGALRHITASGYGYSWFVLDQSTLNAEFALSGSEQNADLTGKDVRLLAGRVRPGPTPEVAAFQKHGVDFLAADTVAELAAKMNQLAGEHLIDAENLQATIHARDLQVRSGLGKDPQVVATSAARKFLGDRLIRVATPHEYLDRSTLASDDAGAGRAGSGGPLVAVRLHVLTRKTLGGLETDLDARVLGCRRERRCRASTPWARRPASAGAACTGIERSRGPSSAAACSPAGPLGAPSPPPCRCPAHPSAPVPNAKVGANCSFSGAGVAGCAHLGPADD